MNAPTTPKPFLLSIVIPCYNEFEVLPALRERLVASLDGLGVAWEVVFVDDGSRDGTYERLAQMHREEPRFKVVVLSRNFGHQVALSAGLAYASGDAVGIMDADLQDPPEILAECLKRLSEGYDVIYAVRRKRKESPLKRLSYFLFYRIMKWLSDVEIPLDAGDFCVISKRVAAVLRRMPEQNIFLRGLRAWAGFRQIGIEYERSARAAGITKYPFKRLIRLATDGMFAFSTMPLRFATYLGLLTVGLGLLASMLILSWRVCGFSFMGHRPTDLPGWTALVMGMLLFSGIQLIILGLIGEYVGRIYTEVKNRPRWLARELLGLPAEPPRQGADSNIQHTRYDLHLD